jgi:signal transduction histidine kinase
VVVQEIDSASSKTWSEVFKALNCKSIVLVPLIVQEQVTGVAIAIESRTPRLFSQDDLLLVESLISQAASALRQAALYEDVRELEKIKSEMIRMASHDLRNPLGNAMAYFELLLTTLNGTLSARQMEFASYVKTSTRAMHELIDDLLTLDRIESERQASWKVFNFTDLVEATFTAQKPNAELKQQFLKLEMKVDTKLSNEMFVYGSTTQIRQAVANLVSNAIKYTPEGGNINVKLWTEKALLKFEVQDTGYGISKERQARLFQRFYRAREATTDHIPGTGLGLSLVKTVVERHGGQVWVESELGVGSKFGFWLPLSPPEEPIAEKDVQHGTLED